MGSGCYDNFLIAVDSLIVERQPVARKKTSSIRRKAKASPKSKQKSTAKKVKVKKTKAKKKVDLGISGSELTLRTFKDREKEFPSEHKLALTSRNFRRLNADEVFRGCSISSNAVDNRKNKQPNYEIIAQERAVRAITVGLGISKPGYNIYVAGVQGTGKTSVIRSFLQKTAESAKRPSDWIYVYNFKSPELPRALEMKTGKAKKFKKGMDELVEALVSEIRDALQSEEYENNVNATVNASNDKKAKMFSDLEKTAKSKNFGVKSTRMGIVTIPIVDGKPLSEKDYAELSDDQKEKIENDRNLLEPEVLDFARKVRAIESDTKSKLEQMRLEIGDYVVTNEMASLRKEYDKSPEVLEYFKEVKEHILENLIEFAREGEDDDEEGEEESPISSHMRKGDPYLPYRVNVFVDNTETKGAPIIIENNPTFYNLFGKIEKNIEYGIYTTDFKMIKAGSLARANGGYLVLNALDVFRMPQVWETLKRVIKNQKLYIEDLGEQYSLLPTSGLRPEPISLNVKIVLIGSDWLYRMLFKFDEDFNKIFKIKADFDLEMERSERNIHDYVDFVTTRSRVENLLPFDPAAIDAIVEFGSRLVDDQDKLSTRFSVIKDLTIEANFMAKERKAQKISRDDVEKAIEERYFRSALVEESMNEMVERGDILLSVNTRRVGEINGLAVYDLGDVSFGKPTRITCRTYSGKPGIVNIEREASLSGKIHNKGVSIITSWINAVFGKKDGVALSASICFEQNYTGVDGDSATMAEMILILSTLANIPLDQGIAVTGSSNQFGEVQPVGGINEKIEGFFKTCQIKGLTGRQGVVIPIQNMKHLMLNRQTREAIEEGRFHVWPVARIEEGFEILTGVTAGEWDEKKGRFPAGTAFETVYKTLHKKDEREKKKKDDHQKKSASKLNKARRKKEKPKSSSGRK